MIGEIVALTGAMNDDDVDPELFSLRSFVLTCQIYLGSNSLDVKCLMDTGCTAYALIHERLVPFICERLGIEPLRLFKPKRVRGFDGKLTSKPISYAIYPMLSVQGRRESTVPMLIADIGQHDAILGKPWMNRNKLLLNMSNDSIIFPSDLASKPSVTPPSTPPILGIPKILPRPTLASNETPFQCTASDRLHITF